MPRFVAFSVSLVSLFVGGVAVAGPPLVIITTPAPGPSCDASPAGADGATLCQANDAAGWPSDVFGVGRDGVYRELRIMRPQAAPGCRVVHLDYAANNRSYLTVTASACVDAATGYATSEELELYSPSAGTWSFSVTPRDGNNYYPVASSFYDAQGNGAPVDDGTYFYPGKQFEGVSPEADLGRFGAELAQAAYFDKIVAPLHLQFQSSPLAIVHAGTDVCNDAFFSTDASRPTEFTACEALLAAAGLMQLSAIEPAGEFGGSSGKGGTHKWISFDAPINCFDKPTDRHCSAKPPALNSY